MPDSSLERTIKLLIKTGILPIKKNKKRRSKKRKYTKHYANENSKSNSIPISYGQPNLSSLNATNQLAFTDNRNKEIEYQNYLNPHLQRINDKIVNTDNNLNILKDGAVNFANILNNDFTNRLNDMNDKLPNLINDDDFFEDVNLRDRKNKTTRFDLLDDDIYNIDTNNFNPDASFLNQGTSHDSNALVYDNGDDENNISMTANLSSYKTPQKSNKSSSFNSEIKVNTPNIQTDNIEPNDRFADLKNKFGNKRGTHKMKEKLLRLEKEKNQLLKNKKTLDDDLEKINKK